MPRTSDPMTVELVPHRAWDDRATIPGWVDFDQYLVYVHSVGLAHRNADCKLQVGIISKKPGANFCPLGELDNFTYAHQQWIAEEAKRLHGEANPKPHTPLPPPIEELSEPDDGEDEAAELDE